MKKHILSLLAVCCFSATAAMADENWLTNYNDALAKAKEQNRPVFMLFTGSDWCPPCIYMDKKVFPTKTFELFAKEHLVLLKVDIPRALMQSPSQDAPNMRLSQSFDVQGFPTMILLSPEGKELGRTSGMFPDVQSLLRWIWSIAKPATAA